MRDLYGMGQPPAMTGPPEEISSFLTRYSHGCLSSVPSKFCHPTIPSSSHPPHAADDGSVSSTVNPLGYRFEFPETELTVTATYSDARRSFGKEKTGVAVPSKRRGGGSPEDKLGDYNYDSEELDGIDVQTKSIRQRSSSKRSRTAEIHNLSEKRRRNRINEKMKALQNLIPNSNKTDKASMLDEVIEYLKQLQLKVQMLTMRNGLSIHPLCLPGVLQPIQLPMAGVSFEEGTHLLNPSGQAAEYPSGQTTINFPNHSTIPNGILMTPLPSIAGSSHGFEPLCPLPHYGPQKELRKDCIFHTQLPGDPRTNPSS